MARAYEKPHPKVSPRAYSARCGALRRWAFLSSLGLGHSLACNNGPPGDSGDTTMSASDAGDNVESGGEYVCPPRTLQGDFHIRRDTELSPFQGVTEIQGSIYFELSSGLALHAFRCLQTVTGALEFLPATDADPGPVHLRDFSRLRQVGQDLAVGRRIGGLPGLASLTGLSGLQFVGGDLIIADNAQLSDLHGLEQLQEVGDELLIAFNPQLRSLAGLGSLRKVRELALISNAALTQLHGLETLREAQKLLFLRNDALAQLHGLTGIAQLQHLEVLENPALVDMSALAGLTRIEATLKVADNHSLLDLRGLEGLRAVEGEWNISGNPLLASLHGLEGLRQITAQGVLSIAKLPALTGLDALAGLQQVEGRLHILHNPKLQQIDALSGLQHLGELQLVGPDALSSLAALASLTSVGDHLLVEDHPQLPSLHGLEQLQRVPGQLTVARLPGLNQLEALRGITQLGEVELRTLPALQGLGPLAARTELSALTIDELPVQALEPGFGQLRVISGELKLVRVAGLRDLSPFAKLERLGGLALGLNPQLNDVRGLESLSELSGGQLCVHKNPQLRSLTGLNGLENIDGPVTLTVNAQLEDISGLSGLVRIGRSLWLDGNPKLASLQAFAGLRQIGGKVWTLGEDCLGFGEGPGRVRRGPVAHGYMGIELRDMPLTSLAGLEQVEMIAGGLLFKANPELRDLTSLHGTAVCGTKVEIVDNPALSSCDSAWPLLMQIQFGGPVRRIVNNQGVHGPKDCTDPAVQNFIPSTSPPEVCLRGRD